MHPNYSLTNIMLKKMQFYFGIIISIVMEESVIWNSKLFTRVEIVLLLFIVDPTALVWMITQYKI